MSIKVPIFLNIGSKPQETGDQSILLKAEDDFCCKFPVKRAHYVLPRDKNRFIHAMLLVFVDTSALDQILQFPTNSPRYFTCLFQLDELSHGNQSSLMQDFFAIWQFSSLEKLQFWIGFHC